MSDIKEILKQHQLKRLARGDRFSEMYDQHVSSNASTAIGVLGGQGSGSSVPISVVQIRAIYNKMLQSYTGHMPVLETKMNKKSTSLWTRVEKAVYQSGCDPERYLKAQFTWFDKAFGRPPTLSQLTTTAAIDRAVEFSGTTKGRVLGNMRKAPITKADTFRESEKLLQNMMTAQSCSREEFYKKFVLTGLYTFPKEFLGADPTYQRLVSK